MPARCRSATSPSGCAASTTPAVGPLLRSLRDTLDAFVDIGLGYLSLDRASGSLSGGEAQRTKMIRHLGSALTDITYVFDEPTVGLHPHDIQRMNELLLQLRDKGNTVLVVEHKPETIAIADHVVDLGPRAGVHGGEIQYEGDIAGLRASDTLTGRHLGYRAQLKDDVRTATGAIEIRGATQHNLQNVGRGRAARHPHGRHGGRGVGQELAHPRLDARRMPTSSRSTRPRSRDRAAATPRPTPDCSTRSAPPSRRRTASSRRCSARTRQGACPNCNGAGVIFSDFGMMGGVATDCEVCEGKRFMAEVLEYQLAGENIAEVLAMSVDESLEYFGPDRANIKAAARDPAADVGRRARLHHSRPATEHALRR